MTNEWADVPFARIVVWQGLVLLFLSQILAWPARPRTIAGGALVVAAALVVAVPLAWVTRRFGNPVFHNPVARRLAVRTDDSAPGLRVLYLLGASLIAGAAVLALLLAAIHAADWLGRAVPGLPALVGRHFH